MRADVRPAVAGRNSLSPGSRAPRISRATAAIVEAWPTGIGVSTMGEGLARAYAFMARGDMGGSRTGPLYGRAACTDEVPKRSDCNYLWVEGEARPEELVAEAQRLERRLILRPGPELGAKLRPWLAEHSWHTDRHLVMAQLREPERTAEPHSVSELDEKPCATGPAAAARRPAWATPEVIEQLFQAKSLIGERVTTLASSGVGARRRGGTDLYVNRGRCPDRGRRHAPRAPKQRLRDGGGLGGNRDRALRSGFQLLFLHRRCRGCGPRRSMRRLAFDELGHYTKFFMPPA